MADYRFFEIKIGNVVNIRCGEVGAIFEDTVTAKYIIKFNKPMRIDCEQFLDLCSKDEVSVTLPGLSFTFGATHFNGGPCKFTIPGKSEIEFVDFGKNRIIGFSARYPI